MKRKRRPAAAVLLTLFLFCSLCFVSAAIAAEEKLDAVWVSVTAARDDGGMPSGSVRWRKLAAQEYALFLPGGTDPEQTRIWFSGIQEIQVNGENCHSGDRIGGLTRGSVLELQAGKKKYTLQVKQGAAIGAVFVETATGSMKKIDADTKYKEAGGRLLFLNPDGTFSYDGDLAHFKLRGNTSAELDKKNYGFKLQKGADLAGLGKAKRWVLIGNGRDLSLLRNQICLDMARYAGLMYTPDAAPVDLYLNQQYHGTYLLTEKIEVNKNRVDIYDLEEANEAVNPDPPESYPRVGETVTYKRGKYKAFALPNNPEDITGGYILEYENYQPRYGTEWCAYTTTRSKVFLFKEPEIVSAEEAEYATGMMQAYEDAIFSPDGICPSTGKHYWEYIDFDSLVRKFMLEEISMNTDGNGSSQFYFKPADSVSTVFFAGPAWDYDATFASFSARSVQEPFLDPTKLLLTSVNKNNYYWPRLYAREEFRDAVSQTWDDTYSTALRILTGQEKDPEGQLLSLAEYAEKITESAEMNFMRWPIAKKKNSSRTGLTWEANVSFLEGILEQRYNTLDTLWGDASK